MVSTRSCSDVAMSTISVPVRPQRVFLLDLPVEIIDKIFSYVGYKTVSQIRTVSRQMNQVCSLVLNSTFQRLQNQIMIRFQSVKAKMPRRESSRRHHPLSCECDIIETVHMRLSLLQMTLGRHIERKHCCFFPGGILDEVLQILHQVRVLGPENLGRPYKVTDELFDLSTMAMEHFKEHIEPGLPDLTYFSKSFLDFGSGSSQSFLVTTSPSPPSSRDGSFTRVQPSPPHMVLRKGIRKIRQGMKKYNNQLTVLRNDLRSCKKKATEQSKLIADQQKLIADQQKQAIDYATRLDENDKKNEEISRKFSTILQELNKCKTELLYWRASGSSPIACNNCGQTILNTAASSSRPMLLELEEPELQPPAPVAVPEPAPVKTAPIPLKRKISPPIHLPMDQGSKSPSAAKDDDPQNSSKMPKKIRRTAVKGTNSTTLSKL